MTTDTQYKYIAIGQGGWATGSSILTALQECAKYAGRKPTLEFFKKCTVYRFPSDHTFWISDFELRFEPPQGVEYDKSKIIKLNI